MSNLGNYTPELAWQFREERMLHDANVLSYLVPDLSGADPAQIYEYLLDAERRLTGVGDFVIGSALTDNEIISIAGNSGVLLTAEHATVQQRLKADGVTRFAKEEDHGTGALAETVATDTGSDALIAIGRQTGDPNNDEQHPFKIREIAEVIEKPNSHSHLSLHGMVRGRASAVRDAAGFSVLLGKGKDPSDATEDLTKTLQETGRDMGLKVGANEPILRFSAKKQEPLMDESGNIKTITFAGSGNTTRAFSEAKANRKLQCPLARHPDYLPEAAIGFHAEIITRDNDLITGNETAIAAAKHFTGSVDPRCVRIVAGYAGIPSGRKCILEIERRIVDPNEQFTGGEVINLAFDNRASKDLLVRLFNQQCLECF